MKKFKEYLNETIIPQLIIILIILAMIAIIAQILVILDKSLKKTSHNNSQFIEVYCEFVRKGELADSPEFNTKFKIACEG